MIDHKTLHVGAEVWWTDPDNGVGSGYYTVKALGEGEIITIANGAGSEVEVFIHELGHGPEEGMQYLLRAHIVGGLEPESCRPDVFSVEITQAVLQRIGMMQQMCIDHDLVLCECDCDFEAFERIDAYAPAPAGSALAALEGDDIARSDGVLEGFRETEGMDDYRLVVTGRDWWLSCRGEWHGVQYQSYPIPCKWTLEHALEAAAPASETPTPGMAP